MDNHIFPGLVFFRPLERILEKKICLRADALTTVPQPLADTLAEKYKREVQVVYNGFDEDDFSGIHQARPDLDKGDYGPKKLSIPGRFTHTCKILPHCFGQSKNLPKTTIFRRINYESFSAAIMPMSAFWQSKNR